LEFYHQLHVVVLRATSVTFIVVVVGVVLVVVVGVVEEE
jgi:hypothetical protein